MVLAIRFALILGLIFIVFIPDGQAKKSIAVSVVLRP
jgi:hypothetical protein